jgi:hypothetical protein
VIDNDGRPAGSIDECGYENVEKMKGKGIVYAHRIANVNKALSMLSDLRSEATRIRYWDAHEPREVTPRADGRACHGGAKGAQTGGGAMCGGVQQKAGGRDR